MQITNELTGEVLEFKTDTAEDVLNSYLELSKYIKTLEQAKKKLQNLAKERDLVDFEHNGYAFRLIQRQSKTYDLYQMQQVFDEDLFVEMVKPDKTKIDRYIRENLEDLGEQASQLRQSMIEAGKYSEYIKLEKIGE